MKLIDYLFISNYKLSLKFSSDNPYFGAVIQMALTLFLFLFLLFVIITRVIIHYDSTIPFSKQWILITPGVLLVGIYRAFKKKNAEALLDEFNSKSFSTRTLWTMLILLLPFTEMIILGFLLKK